MYCKQPGLRVAIILVCFAPLAIGVEAQEFKLLDLPEVRKHLGLSADQETKAEDLIISFQQQIRQYATGISGGTSFDRMSSSEQVGFRAQFLEEMKKVDQEQLSRLQELLTAEQLVRIKQLRYQAMGPKSLQNGLLSKELEVTDEQRELMNDAAKAVQESFRENQQELQQFSREELLKRFRNELRAAFVEQLSDQQKKKYKELTGEAFDIAVIEGLR